MLPHLSLSFRSITASDRLHELSSCVVTAPGAETPRLQSCVPLARRRRCLCFSVQCTRVATLRHLSGQRAVALFQGDDCYGHGQDGPFLSSPAGIGNSAGMQNHQPGFREPGDHQPLIIMSQDGPVLWDLMSSGIDFC